MRRILSTLAQPVKRCYERKMKLHEAIAQRRQSRGISLRQLEEKAGVSNSLLSQIETWRVKEPGFRTVAKISKALGLSLKQLAATE